jgi:hypothetical protein
VTDSPPSSDALEGQGESQVDAWSTSPVPSVSGDAPPVGSPAAASPMSDGALVGPSQEPAADPVLDQPASAPAVGADRADADPMEGPVTSTRVRPPLPRIIAVANQKGGVGKTTTTVNLGACLADLGYRTLVVDLDPQGNASTGLGINIRRTLEASMYDVIMNDVPIEDCVEPSSVRTCSWPRPASTWPAPRSSWSRRSAESSGSNRRWPRCVDDYDYVLIDCPPSLGLLTVNGWPPPPRCWCPSSASTTHWRASANCCGTWAWSRRT